MRFPGLDVDAHVVALWLVVGPAAELGLGAENLIYLQLPDSPTTVRDQSGQPAADASGSHVLLCQSVWFGLSFLLLSPPSFPHLQFRNISHFTLICFFSVHCGTEGH